MKSVRVLCATKSDKGDIRVVKEVEDDDGNLSLNLHIFHEETLEWHAAQLGYDPETELDKVLDLVLYEPFFPSGYSDLYKFDDIASAKAELEGHVSDAKIRLKPTEKPGRATINDLRSRIDSEYISEAEPLAEIKRLSVVDRKAYEVKREIIDRQVEAVRNERSKQAGPPVDRIEALRLRLRDANGRHQT